MFRNYNLLIISPPQDLGLHTISQAIKSLLEYASNPLHK